MDFLADYWFLIFIPIVAWEVLTLVPWGRWFGRGAAPRKSGAELRRRARTEARIYSIQRTGLSINDVPEVELALHAELPGRTHEWRYRKLVDPLVYHRIQPGNTLTVCYDPDELDNFATELDDERFAGSAALQQHQPEAAISVTGATLESPLWAFGHDGAESWLVPPRGARTPVSVIVFSDPHSDQRQATEGNLAQMASHLLAEALWMNTDAPTGSAIMVATEQRKLHVPTGPIKAYEDFEGYLGALPSRPVAIWGAAQRDLTAEGFQIKLRWPGAGADFTFAVPLQHLADAGVTYLTGAGMCARTPAPGWYAPIPPGLAPFYATQLDALQLLILGDRKNNHLIPITDDFYESTCDLANDIAEAYDHVLLSFGALAICHYAARAGRLSPRQRDRALAILARYGGDHPIYKLSPSYLQAFGLVDAAHRRRAELAHAFGGAYRASGDPYQAWLARLPWAAQPFQPAA